MGRDRRGYAKKGREEGGWNEYRDGSYEYRRKILKIKGDKG